MRADKSLQQWLGAPSSSSVLIALAFTDIVGSTDECNQVGDEAWIEILISHFRRARRVVRQFDGFEIKIIGDAFMVAFRSVRQAVSFAIELQRKTGHEQVHIRAGIHLGSVRVIENDLYGSMVNFTSRVVHAAEGESIAISGDAMRNLGADIGRGKAETLGIRSSVQFKGFDEPQIIWILNPDAWWEYGECHPLPNLDACTPGIDPVLRFSVVQAEDRDIDWIAELEASEYTPDDAVPKEILLSWFRRNPHGFSVIEDPFGARIGHVDVLPINSESAKPFLKGRVVEREIQPEWIFTPAERDQIRDLYVESIIIAKNAGVSGARALQSVLREFSSLVGRLCDASQIRDIYAIEATASGKNLITKIGFERCGEAHARTDEHELFKLPAETLWANVQRWVC